MNQRRAFNRLHLAVSLIPWATLAYFTLYAFSARLLLGYWPCGYGDGYRPSDLTCPVLRNFAWGGELMELLLSLSVLAWFVLTVTRCAMFGRRSVWRAQIVFALGWLAIWQVWQADPVGFVSWWW